MKTILLADDKKNIRDFCKQELEDEGYQVILARDGREAIKLVQQRVTRSGHSGYLHAKTRWPRCSRADSGDCPRIPIILFTANDEDCVTDCRSRHAWSAWRNQRTLPN